MQIVDAGTAAPRRRVLGLILTLLATSAAAHAQTSADVVIHAADAVEVRGTWQRVADTTAASGARFWQPNANAPKIAAPLAAPQHYFDVQFRADSGRAYRLWVRSKADGNYWGNDSVHLQFSGSVDASGASVYRIGTTSATTVVREDCSGCAFRGWGWQDNEYGNLALGPEIRFAQSGLQTVRVQAREDGTSIDQIVLSSATWLTTAPGAKNDDTTIHPKSVAPPPSPSTTLAFTAQSLEGLGAYDAVAAVDLNGDGRRDVAGAFSEANTISSALNSGNRAFRAGFAAEYSMTASTPARLVPADFNGDGKADLLEFDARGNAAAIFFGEGTGGFSTTPAQMPFAERVSDVAAADFTGDGILDLAVIERDTGNVVAHAGRGDGTFAFVSFAAAGATPSEIVPGDFDGDRRQDVAVRCGTIVAVLYGDGTGRFERTSVINLPALAIGAADLDDDGYSDLAIGWGRVALHVLYGATPGFTGGTNATTSEMPGAQIAGRGITFGDMNGDAQVDVVVTHSNTSDVDIMSTFAVLANSGTRGFTAGENFAKVGPLPAVVADMDGDGRPDVLSPTGSAGASIYWNDPAQGNRAPVADAGQDVTVVDQDQATVQLDGRGSRDADGHAIEYVWTGQDGTRLWGPRVRPFPHGGYLPGTYTFTLTVDDLEGGKSSDTVTVTIQRPGSVGNRPPVASVSVSLDGVWPYEMQFQDMPDPQTGMVSTSTDPDGDTLTCEWRNAAGDIVTTACGWDTNTAPPLGPGTHTFTLTVRDGRGGESSATASVTVTNFEEIVIAGSGYKELVRGTEWEEFEDPDAVHLVVRDRDAGVPKVTAPLAAPASYVEYGFVADPTLEYKLWIRLKAQNNYWGNDSIWVQFGDATDAAGTPVFRDGTTSGLAVNLEECSGCGISGWGWRDDAWGAPGVMSSTSLRFPAGGVQSLRIQTREDGVSVDTIVLSARKYKTTRPGAVKNDATRIPMTAFWGS